MTAFISMQDSPGTGAYACGQPRERMSGRRAADAKFTIWPVGRRHRMESMYPVMEILLDVFSCTLYMPGRLYFSFMCWSAKAITLRLGKGIRRDCRRCRREETTPAGASRTTLARHTAVMMFSTARSRLWMNQM